MHSSLLHILALSLDEEVVISPTTNNCLYIDVIRHILISRYIYIDTSISGQRE
jgi:hypothetical protein